MDAIYNRKLPSSTTATCTPGDYPSPMPRKAKTKPRGPAATLDEFSQRLVLALDEHPSVPKDEGKRSQRRRWMAEKWGVSQEMARKYLMGESMPEPKQWKMIANSIGVLAAWLFLGEGEKKPRTVGHPLSLQGDNFEQTKAPAIADFPMLNWERLALRGDGMKSKVEEPEPVEANPLAALSRETFLLVVRGSSMEPRFKDGSVIFVDPKTKARHGSFVVARLPGATTATLKQLVVEDGRRLLRATNPAWPDQFTPLGAGEIIGVVKFSGQET